MARARNIKPGLFKNEVLGVADPLYTLLFEGLWLLADREGRLEDRPMRIKGELFPYRDGLDMGSMLSWLESEGFIHRYSSNGLALIQILAFAKHQTPHGTEKDSTYPDENGMYTVHVRGKNGYATGEFSLSDSLLTVKAQNTNPLTPDSGFLIPDSGLTEGAGAPPTPPKSKKKPAATGLPDGFGVSERVRTWATEKGYGQLDQHLAAFLSKVRAKGYTYVSWDDAFMEAIREDWAKLRGRDRNGIAPPPEQQAPRGPDPELLKIERDRLTTTTMPAAVRELAARLTGKATA